MDDEIKVLRQIREYQSEYIGHLIREIEQLKGQLYAKNEDVQINGDVQADQS